MLTGIDETTRKGRNVVLNGDGAVRASLYGCRYVDLGQLISAEAVAAGATIYSSFVDNVQWVRWVILFGQAGNTWEAGIAKRDSSGAVASNEPWLSSQPANAPLWKPITSTPVSGPCTPGILGYSTKFYIKNVSVSVCDMALRAQLIGG